MHRCLQNKAPVYLVDCCTPVSDIPITFGRRAFSVAGLTVWNSLPLSLRDPALSSNSFRQSLKTNRVRRYHSAHTAQ